MLQTGPRIWSLMVPDGSIAVAAPRWSWCPLQALVGAAAGCRAPYWTHTVSICRWHATAAATATAAGAVAAAVTDSAH